MISPNHTQEIAVESEADLTVEQLIRLRAFWTDKTAWLKETYGQPDEAIA